MATAEVLMMANRCNRDSFIAACDDILFTRDEHGNVIVGEEALPFVEKAENGEIIVLTNSQGIPISYLEEGIEREITDIDRG